MMYVKMRSGWLQVDNWLNQRPFDSPAPAEQGRPMGPVIVIGAGPAGLAAARHLKVKPAT